MTIKLRVKLPTLESLFHKPPEPRKRGEFPNHNEVEITKLRPKRPVIHVKRIVPTRTFLRPKGPNRMVPCGLCAGRKPEVSKCPRCSGHGTMPLRTPDDGVILRTAKSLVIRKRFTLEDLLKIGFEQTGVPTEIVSTEKLMFYAQKWHGTSSPMERGHWAGLLAQSGWFRRPLTSAELAIKYPPPIRKEEPTTKYKGQGIPRTKLRLKVTKIKLRGTP